MFTALGSFIYGKRWATLVVSTLFLALSIAVVLRGGTLTGATFGDNEAVEAQRLTEKVLGHSSTTTFVAIFHSDTLDPRTAAFQSKMHATLAPLAKDPNVLEIMTPEDAPPALAPAMVNGDARSAVAMISLRGDFKAALAHYPSVRERLRSNDFVITCTGQVPFMDNFDRVLQHDLVRAEIVSLPLALMVLLLAFRTVVAAGLPVGIGALAVVGGIAVVMGLSHVLDMAEYTINVCSLIGLGVAIDYSLFTVSRYREELAAGHDYREALVRALDGAGRVVCFSGLAVGTGLAGLMFFGGSFLWALGVGGAVVVVLAVVFALTFLPALLAVLGPRIHAWRVPIGRFGPSDGFWHRAAQWVMRRPLAVLVPTLAVLAVMASPFRHIELIAADVRVLGAGVEARKGFEALKRDFPELGNNRVVVAVTFPTAPALTPERISALYDLSKRIAAIPHVTKVDSIVSAEGLGKEDLQTVLIDPPDLYKVQIEAGKKMTVADRYVLLYAVTDSAPETRASEDVVRAMRRQRAVLDGSLVVGGQTAENMDGTEFIRERTPRAIAFVMVMTFVILFLMFGSVIIPLKAMAMNFVSVASSFGALVWIFQEGHLGIADVRPIDHGLPVLLFCILFGLSMDYEVLMLSRIKETYDATHDNTHAVADGLEKTAGLITSAAAIMVCVFVAFAFAKIVLIQAVGFGMALAVAIDATLVRLLLAPATMRLFGDKNWWAPKPLLALRSALGFGR
jgi:RND superfamily putative drug exporter